MTFKQSILAASMVAFGLLTQPVLSHASEGDQVGPAKQGCDYHHGDMKHHGGMKEYGFDHMAHWLNLSAEQQTDMKAIETKYRPEMKELWQLSRDNRQALEKMDASDPKLQELANAQGKTIADMTVLRKQMRAQMDKVLTDAQRQKLKSMSEHGWHHHWHDDMNQD